MPRVTLKVRDLKPGQCMAEIHTSELEHHWARRIACEVAEDVPDAMLVTVNLEVVCSVIIDDATAPDPKQAGDLAARVAELEAENAALRNSEERCEGCNRVATKYDSQGVPLCLPCWQACVDESYDEDEPTTPDAAQPQETDDEA